MTPLTTRPLLLAINSLEGGGAERVMVALAGALAAWRPERPVHLALLDDLPRAYDVPDTVTVHTLGARGLPGAAFELFRLRRRLRPAACLSFLRRSNFANVLASLADGTPALVSERANASAYLARQPSRATARLIRHLYSRAARVIAVSEGVKADLVQTFGLSPARVEAIPNPIDLERTRARAAEPAPDRPRGPYLVAVGRLVATKNMALLLRAFAEATRQARETGRETGSETGGETLRLLVLGEGPERPAIEALATELGIADRVRLAGFASNPFPLVRGARAYLSASNLEGFPNTLVEALALGTPAVATDCASGPAEILADRIEGGARGVIEAPFGLLVEPDNVAALADAIRRIQAEPIQALYRAAGPRRAADYALDAVVGRYEAALDAAITAQADGRGSPRTAR